MSQAFTTFFIFRCMLFHHTSPRIYSHVLCMPTWPSDIWYSFMKVEMSSFGITIKNSF
ncbi:hypothetical protein HHI36_015350 [Cryptolaemus montrouzieri]|uniref:Uncharacterized protein n=1 Tax=Cryptolaemus montrouzieri TaxID=559131 RepID=A0ABD2MQI0_9CUCU